MSQSQRAPSLPSSSKPIHHTPQRRFRLLWPRRQLLWRLTLLHITTPYNTALLLALRRRSTAAILRHFHFACCGIGFRTSWRRIVLWWRFAIIHWRRPGERRTWLLLLLWVWLAIGIVALWLCVKSKVILGDLAVAFTFRVGYKELSTVDVSKTIHLIRLILLSRNGNRADLRDDIPTKATPSLTVVWRVCILRQTTA
jgi:hypothetical protein